MFILPYDQDNYQDLGTFFPSWGNSPEQLLQVHQASFTLISSSSSSSRDHTQSLLAQNSDSQPGPYEIPSRELQCPALHEEVSTLPSPSGIPCLPLLSTDKRCLRWVLWQLSLLPNALAALLLVTSYVEQCAPSEGWGQAGRQGLQNCTI